jgi:hypothetical protein
MQRKKLLLGSIIALTLTGAGCSLTQTINVNEGGSTNTNGASNVNRVSSITYSGQASKNALDLLKAKHQVDVSAQGFVNAIDKIKPGDHQYWSFYVNDKQADVGAKDYITKSTDAIEWKLEAF